MDLLQSYSWPGNIRELQNVIERSVIVCDTENLSVDESWLGRGALPVATKSQALSERLATQEKELIEAALAESHGRVSGPSGAAAKLGVPQSTLDSKIRSLKIGERVTFRLTGRIHAEQVPELLDLLRSESSTQRITLDLEQVKLVDRDAVLFLALSETRGSELKNCSAYIRKWIDQERNAR